MHYSENFGGSSSDVERAPRALAPLYEVQRVLGRGGMATVYLARETKHGRPVAVKVLDADSFDDAGTERFLFEIHLTAHLSHPHIVPLLDSGNAGGKPFYVMPFVSGGTLRVCIDGGPLDTNQVLKIAGEVSDALAYAHAQGILHRDVKPENIMMSGRSAVVTDFGIARALRAIDEPDAHSLDVGTAMGTPAYMSPEQAAGEQDLDERSDVYSLGAVMYEMLTGAPPFVGDTVLALMAKRFVEPPPSPRAKRADLCEAVDVLVMRAMAVTPTDRYASAAEFCDAIARVRVALESPQYAVITGTSAAVLPSVAVLPFENATGISDDDFVASGITDEVLTSLAKGGRIRVAGRGSAFVVAGQQVDARAICERLGVRTVLMGSVRRSGHRLRVTAQLISGADGFHLWSDRFDRTMDDLFAVQDEIAGHISTALHGALLSTVSAAEAPRPVAPDAYYAYLRGRHLLRQRTASAMQAAQEWFTRALALDAHFAAAHAGLAETWALLGVYGELAPRASFDQARREAQLALADDPSLAAAHAVLGLVHAGFDWDLTRAAQSFDASARAMAEPNAYQWLATMVLLPRGQFEEALKVVGSALRIDPLSLAARSTLTVAFLYSRRFEEAIHAARETLELDPHFSLAHYFLAQALSALGDITGAAESAGRACELSGRSGETVAFAAYAHGRAGHAEEAARYATELRARNNDRYVSATHLALVALGIGETDAALSHLEHAVEARATELIWLGVRPAWAALREHARFEHIMARVGVTTHLTNQALSEIVPHTSL